MPERRSRAEARIRQWPTYQPDLDAYGLKLEEGDSQPVPDITQLAGVYAEGWIDPAKLLTDPKAQIDARLWEGKFDVNGRLRESRVTPRMSRDQMGGRYTRLRERLKLSESDWFSLGGYGGGVLESPLTSNYVPMIPGPATRQQYWADYWASSAKCFEASTHSGIARRACAAMVHFPLGRGVKWRIDDDQARETWELFWRANRMRRRIKSIAYDLSVFGEQMLRYFPATTDSMGRLTATTGRGARSLIIRQIDPATIYEIVTDQEDLETVYFYHQQFQTRMELYSPPAGGRTPEGRTESGVTRYIIRQIPAEEVDHYAVHTVSGEARGRSDLFPALGDLKRMRDLLTSKVVQADIANRVMAILKANGTGGDLNRVLNTIFPNGQPPAPGTVIALNEANDLEPFEYNGGKEVRADFTYDELVDSVCAAVGVSRPYLGLSPAVGSGTTQATAMNQVTPDTKAFEDRQQLLDEMLHDMFDRVMNQAGINREIEREFLFPEIAKEDSSPRLDQLEMATANNWISHKTAATAAASELDFTDYDYDEEQKLIVEEFQDAAETDGEDELGNGKPAQGEKIRRRMIRATARQVPMLDPSKAQGPDDEPLGVMISGDQVVGGPGGGAGDSDPTSKNPLSKTGAAAIKKSVREASRRLPDDPELAGHAAEFQRETEENLRRVLQELEA
jgi:hypothetical protein